MQDTTLYSISVVIPNYNGKDLLERNLPSCFMALQSSNISDFEIIISDDKSTDDSVRFIEGAYPMVILLQNKGNRGFSGNMNNGIHAATKDLVFILNNDVLLTEHYFVPLLSLFRRSDTFGVMGKIVDLDSDRMQDGAKFPGYSFSDIKGTVNYVSKSSTLLYSLFASGANALVDRKKLILLGGFSEIYNSYNWEDVDLGIRAWRIGYKVYYEGSAYCRHPRSATLNKEPGKNVQKISKRNKMYLHYLHLEGLEFYCFMLKIFTKSFFRLLIGDFSYVKSYILFIRSLPQLSETKRSFKMLQQSLHCCLSTRDIIERITESTRHLEIEKF